MEDLLSMALPETVTLTIRCDEGPMHARIDPGQLESAILNLCVNAGQAIEDEGHIEIAVTRQTDGTISLSVKDDGCGMDADTLRQAAEPFFSARANGEGTGLGLSMVHGFAHQSGGTIHIASKPGHGTCVTLTFPQQPGGQTTHSVETVTGNGIRHALVVDDDRRSAAAISGLMTRFGYKVTTEHCFEDAKVRIGRDMPYSIVVTDLQLDNGHSGWDLVAKALDAHPDCRVVAVSGHLPQDDLFSDRFPERFSKLPKPVDAEALAEKIGMKLHVPA